MKNLKAFVAVMMCVVGLLGCATPGERVSVYNYNLYFTLGNFDRAGDLVLRESSQGATVRIVAGVGMSPCITSPLTATVTWDATYTTIETDPLFGNCDRTKYQIKNDGSGGSRYTFANGLWTKDAYDRGLTPKK